MKCPKKITAIASLTLALVCVAPVAMSATPIGVGGSGAVRVLPGAFAPGESAQAGGELVGQELLDTAEKLCSTTPGALLLSASGTKVVCRNKDGDLITVTQATEANQTSFGAKVCVEAAGTVLVANDDLVACRNSLGDSVVSQKAGSGVNINGADLETLAAALCNPSDPVLLDSKSTSVSCSTASGKNLILQKN